MNSGAILTREEAESIRKRLSAISLVVRDRRIREQVRLTQLTINKGIRRAARYEKEEADLLKLIDTNL